MRTYEFIFIVKPTLSEADRKKLVDNIKSWLKALKVVKEEEWGQKVLAYPIKKERSGYYFRFTLEGENGVPKDVERRIIENEDVLRQLLIRRS